MAQYRVAITSYDIFDEKYATALKKVYILQDELTRFKFDTFTNNLMDDKSIKRHFLLNAINDYQKSELSTLKDYFTDAAFNFRP
jgi:hypothetical protein